MRLSVRIGSAALLILAIVLIMRHLDGLQDDARVQSSFWSWDFLKNPQSIASDAVASPDRNNHANPDIIDQTAFEEPAERPPPTYETTPIIVPNDRVIVIARLSSEDTSWVSNDLAEWRNVIYTVDDTNAPRHTPKNKGRESLAYLQYIVEHYHDLPATIVFVHSHKDGWPAAWHTDTLDYSNVQSIRSLQTDFVQRNGYANLRCQETPGCPDEIRPFRDPRPGKATEKAYAQAWEELFNNTDVPEVIGVPCCSQFAVSRDQVLKRSLDDYERYYNWVLTNKLSDDVTAHIMEYTWHIIFGMDPVYCPDAFQCYQDVYGDQYFW